MERKPDLRVLLILRTDSDDGKSGLIAGLFASRFPSTSCASDSSFTGAHHPANKIRDALPLESPCVTPAQFQAMVAAANASQGGSSSGASNDNSPAATSTDATDTPPVIQINGNNPAIIHVGDTYNDLGATITGPIVDLNLDIQTYLNGTLVSPIVIDTSTAATDTIQYVVSDPQGLTSTSTRTVLIQPAANDNTPPAANDNQATTTAATSTSQ